LTAIGLGLAAAHGGRRGIAARFMIVMVLIAFVGSIAQQVPFGPTLGAARLVLWMTPIVAFGLAVVLQWVRRRVTRHGRSWRLGFDVSAFAVAGILLVTGFGAQPAYPEGGADAASRQAMQQLQPRDALVVTPPAMFSFAVSADTPVVVQADPDRNNGYVPLFRDPRLHALIPLDEDQLHHAVQNAERVFIVDSAVDRPLYKAYRLQLARGLEREGFVVDSTTDVNGGQITIWRRA
jgi:hypothetical protein